MTSELRPAVDVWLEADAAHIDFDGWWEGKLQAAAAVIEADREAVRAEQAAYLAKARKEAGQNHDLHMAAVNEVVDLKAELAKFKALAETLAEALHHRGGPLCPARYYGDAQCTCGVAEALREYKEARDETSN